MTSRDSTCSYIWNGLVYSQLLCQEEKTSKNYMLEDWMTTDTVHMWFLASHLSDICCKKPTQVSWALAKYICTVVEVGTIPTPIFQGCPPVVWSPYILCICKKAIGINVQSQYTGPLKNVNCFCVISRIGELSTFISQGRPPAACATRMPSLCIYITWDSSLSGNISSQSKMRTHFLFSVISTYLPTVHANITIQAIRNT